MSSLRKAISKQIKWGTETVEHDGETYLLAGLPSAKATIGTMDQDENKKLATLFSNTIKAVKDTPEGPVEVKIDFTPEDVQQIKIVSAYVQPEPGEAPYDLTILAEIFAGNGVLFLKLIGAAGKLMSPKDLGIVEVAAGNS